MFDTGILIISFVVTPLFSVFQLRSAINHLCSLGKSKTKLKKERRGISVGKRILLLGYVETCKYYSSKARKFRYIYWSYIIILFICIILWLLSAFTSSLSQTLKLCALAKIYVLDIPINLYSFIMTKHDKKHGGCTWVWDIND